MKPIAGIVGAALFATLLVPSFADSVTLPDVVKMLGFDPMDPDW
jgi:hypothetical protein